MHDSYSAAWKLEGGNEAQTSEAEHGKERKGDGALIFSWRKKVKRTKSPHFVATKLSLSTVERG